MSKRPATHGDDDDARMFARAMADVARLKADSRGRQAVRPAAKAVTIALPRTPAKATPSSSDHDLDGGYVSAGVDRRELRKLRRGDHAPGHRLDLHGMTGAEAVARVQRFIDSSRKRYRCVAIVHGRGLHSAGNVSVLKTRVRQLLRGHHSVLAFADAPRSDGGAGAVYVLLRK